MGTGTQEHADSGSTLQRVSELDAVLKAQGLRAANNLIELVALISSWKGEGRQCEEGVPGGAAHAVRRGIGRLHRAIESAENATLTNWFGNLRSSYGTALIDIVGAPQSSIGDGLTLKDVRDAVVCAGVLGTPIWNAAVLAAIRAKRGEEMRTMLERYGDLRVATISCVTADPTEIDEQTLGAGPLSETEKVEALLMCTAGEPAFLSCATAVRNKKSDDEDKLAALRKSIRRALCKAWITTLSSKDLPPLLRQQCLARAASDIIPNISNALALSDVLTDAYTNSNDVDTAIASLDGLFVLISQHRLDFPDFYPKLYAMLTPEVLFFAPGRRRFLELTTMFLTKGSYLPGVLVAAFIKRLMRRALVAPAEGAMWCMRVALELLYKHPSVAFLVHRSVNLFDSGAPQGMAPQANASEAAGADPFDDNETDPHKSGANESSLWELDALRTHASPGVSRLVDTFSKDVRKRPPPPPGSIEDYADLSFADVFGAEFKRRAKSIPLAYHPPGEDPRESAAGEMPTAISWT